MEIKTTSTLSTNQRRISLLTADKALVHTQTTLRVICAAQL